MADPLIVPVKSPCLVCVWGCHCFVACRGGMAFGFHIVVVFSAWLEGLR